MDNPIRFIDPDGMGVDWFENENTGDVYYNSELKKGDETKLGEGWVHLGKNGMFSKGNSTTSDFSIIAKNEQLASKASINYADSKLTGEASFEGEKAESFMSGQDYQKVTKQATQELETTTATGAFGTRGEITVSNTKVLSESIEKVEYVPNNYELIGSHLMNTVKQGLPIVGVGVSNETVQYRFEYGVPSKFIKTLDLIIKLGSIQSGNFDTSKK